MKAIVTGAGGFIGSHLVDLLHSNGFELTLIDSYEYGPNDNLTDPNSTLIKTRMQDVNWTSLIDTYSPDFIFNLAAMNMNKSMEDPYLDLDTTIGGLVKMLTGIRESDSDVKIIHSSSGSVYGEPIFSPQEETHPQNPTSPYGVAKKAAEEYLQLFNQLYGIKFIGLRYYNVYGPRQYFGETGGVIPIFIKNMLEDKSLYITGDGSQERSFTYVQDVVETNLKVTENVDSQFYNVAHQKSYSINELATTLQDILGKKTEINYIDERLGEIMKFQPNIQKLKGNHNISCETTLLEGLKPTINYYKEIIL